jgi:hypothetical protein
MEGSGQVSDAIFIKKDIFIKTRKEDIRLYYEFNPKVANALERSLGGEHMELFTKHALNNLPTPTGWSSSSLRRW